MDTILLLIIIFIGVGLFASLGTCNKKDYLIVFLILAGLTSWLILASVQPTKYDKVTTHNIHSKTLDSGEQFQYSFIGDEVVSVTRLFSTIYPSTFKLEKKVIHKWSYGIYFLMFSDIEYSIINSDGVEVISRSVKRR